jgi:hypothetical protein
MPAGSACPHYDLVVALGVGVTLRGWGKPRVAQPGARPFPQSADVNSMRSIVLLEFRLPLLLAGGIGHR